MAKVATEDRALQEKVFQWAQELYYRPHTAEDVGLTRADVKILCSGDLAPVCKFLVDNVVTKRKAYQIRKALHRYVEDDRAVSACPKLSNYEAQRRKKADRKAQLMQRRLALQRQLLQVDRNTEASLTECESKSREVARLSSQLSTERKQLSEKRQKMLLYESYAKEMVRFMHILRKYAERLRAFVAECKSIATDRRPYMGTAHSQVQQTLSMLEAVIAEALKSGRDDINRTSWTALKEKLQGSTPLDFLQLMMRNVDEAMEHVHQCESGTTADTHADIWLGKLQTYLEDGAVAHAERCTEARTLNADALAIEREFDEASRDSIRKLGALRCTIITRKSELHAARAVRDELRAHVEQYQSLSVELEEEWQDILQKHRSLCRTRDDLAPHLKTLKSLRMGITESRELLLDWYEKARTQVTGRITDLSSAVSLVASILAGFCIADYKLFYGVPMHKLVRAKPSHLVTHRIMHSPVERLQTILGLRRYAPPESLVRDIVRMRGQVLAVDIAQRLQNNIEEDMTSAYLACIAELQSHTADLETANGLSDIVTWVNDCASFWRQVYMSEIVPGLQDTLQHADDCRITLEEIREMTQQRREYLALVELSDVE